MSAIVMTILLLPLISAGMNGLCSLPFRVNDLISLPNPLTVISNVAFLYLKLSNVLVAANALGTKGAKASPSFSKCIPKSIL